MQSMLNTHQLYQTLLTETNSRLLHDLQQLALQAPLEKATERLQVLLVEHRPSPVDATTIDYGRFYALLRKDFMGCDLRGEDFAEMNLEGFNFKKAKLNGTCFNRTNLSEADFTGADLSEVQASSAQMRKAILYGSELREAFLGGTDLSEADLSRANLSEANLSEANLRKANLREANLSRADLIRANLSEANLYRSSCCEVNAYEAWLTEANWFGVDLTGARMVRVEASGALFGFAKLKYADLSFAVLRKAHLSNANCAYSNCYRADLREADLRETQFFCADLQGANLEGADLTECTCSEAHFGEFIQISASTVIGLGNHALIGMALLRKARTPEQRQFALYVKFQRDLCWPDFTELLLRHNSDMAAWVKASLMEVRSLRLRVERHEKKFQELLQIRQELDLSDIHQQLHLLLLAEIRQHADLGNSELYWYLRGVLEMACQRPDMQVDEEQKRVVLMRLQQQFISNKERQ